MKRYHKALVIYERDLKESFKNTISDALRDRFSCFSPIEILDSIKFDIAEIWRLILEDEKTDLLIVLNEEDNTYHEFICGTNMFEYYRDFISSEFRHQFDKFIDVVVYRKSIERKIKIVNLIKALAEKFGNQEFLIAAKNLEDDLENCSLDSITDMLLYLLNYEFFEPK